MPSELQQEVNRVVGGKSVRVNDLGTAEIANPRVRVETAEAVYDLPANELLTLLRELPDHIGVNALRLSIDEHFPS